MIFFFFSLAGFWLWILFFDMVNLLLDDLCFLTRFGYFSLQFSTCAGFWVHKIIRKLLEFPLFKYLFFILFSARRAIVRCVGFACYDSNGTRKMQFFLHFHGFFSLTIHRQSMCVLCFSLSLRWMLRGLLKLIFHYKIVMKWVCLHPSIGSVTRSRRENVRWKICYAFWVDENFVECTIKCTLKFTHQTYLICRKTWFEIFQKQLLAFSVFICF